MFGIKLLSKTLTSVYSNKIKDILSKYINSDFTALLLGIVLTALCQSSNAITIITLSLINANYLSFSKGLIIIIGSNIGTTITAFLISFDFDLLIPIFLFIGFILYMKESKKNVGLIFISLGITFYSLNIMSINFSKLISVEYIYTFINRLNNSSFFSFIFGVFLSSLIQSSSASIGIIQKLSNDGLILLSSSISFMLGANIGTTLTGLISSFASDTKTKKVASINVVFNLITSILFLIILPSYSSIVSFIGNKLHFNNMSKIALSHFLYNAICVLIFYYIYTKRKKVD